MRGALVLAGALLGAASLVGAPAHGSTAVAPDPYSGAIQTQCSIDVPAVVRPGKHVRITVGVSANSPTRPTGKIKLTITDAGPSPEVAARGTGDVVWTKTVPYNGGTKKVVGPVLPKDRAYAAQARFIPRDDTFRGCRATDPFVVANVDDNQNPPDEGPDGLLPDTGGPALLWLLLGVGLIGGGAAAVVYSRRRRSPTTPA